MDSNCSYNPRIKPLLKLIFENCNNDDKCKYKIYQSEDNIDYISMKLSCVSKFIERLVKIVKSELSEKEQIEQIQRFKDHTHKPIFNKDNSTKLLKLMKLFINHEQIKRKKRHNHRMKHKPVYNKCMTKIMRKQIYHNIHSHSNQDISMENRDLLIQKIYDSLNKDELNEIKNVISDLNTATSYVQEGGSNSSQKVSFDEISKINRDFFKELFMRVSTKIQEDKIYGTLDSIVDYKKRLEMFIRESVQDMEVPDHLRYFVDNINNLVDAIYPSNILDFVREDTTKENILEKEISEPYELIELLLFALSVIPIPIINLIPDFMLIVHNLLKGKKILFTILSSIALIIKVSTLLFFDLGPILKMFYLSKKIKNFNMEDISQVLNKSVGDILTVSGGLSNFASGIISETALPLASPGQLRPENFSLQLGNNMPLGGSNPVNLQNIVGQLANANKSGTSGTTKPNSSKSTTSQSKTNANVGNALNNAAGLANLASSALKSVGGTEGLTNLASSALKSVGGTEGLTNLASSALKSVGGTEGLANLAKTGLSTLSSLSKSGSSSKKKTSTGSSSSKKTSTSSSKKTSTSSSKK